MNNDKGEQVKEIPQAKPKRCPFLQGKCREDNCAVSVELTQNTGGVVRRGHTCALNALVMMISEMNQKAMVQQQSRQVGLQLPGQIFKL